MSCASVSICFQSQIKDYLRELDEVRQARDDLSNVARENEKKAKNFEAEVMQLHEDLSAAERQRKAAEAERDDLQEELSGGARDK